MNQLVYQESLFALLKYYEAGNRPKFGELVSKSLEYSGLDLSSRDQRWISFVTFNILKYVGVIDASETNITRWSYSLNNGCFIEGSPQYFIGASDKVDSLRSEDGNWIPFFTEDSKHKFALHKYVSKHNKPFISHNCGNPIYSNIFEARCPSWHQVESMCLSEDLWIPFLTCSEIDVFDFDEGDWVKRTDTEVADRSLVRIPLEYSAMEYRIVFPKKNRSLRIIYPEWAFITASRLLGKPFPGVFEPRDDSLSLSWRSKLPTIVMRYLCSDEPEIYSRYSLLKVENVDIKKIKFLINKFDFTIKGVA